MIPILKGCLLQVDRLVLISLKTSGLEGEVVPPADQKAKLQTWVCLAAESTSQRGSGVECARTLEDESWKDHREALPACSWCRWK